MLSAAFSILFHGKFLKIGSLSLHMHMWYEKWYHPQWLHDTTTTGYGHKLFWILLTKTSGGGHFMTYYTSSKYYGRTRMHESIVPRALRALGTKIIHDNLPRLVSFYFPNAVSSSWTFSRKLCLYSQHTSLVCIIPDFLLVCSLFTQAG